MAVGKSECTKLKSKLAILLAVAQKWLKSTSLSFPTQISTRSIMLGSTKGFA